MEDANCGCCCFAVVDAGVVAVVVDEVVAVAVVAAVLCDVAVDVAADIEVGDVRARADCECTIGLPMLLDAADCVCV